MEDFVNFKLAQKLKENGFREKCLLHYEATGGFYSNSIDTYDRPNQELDYSDFLECYNDGIFIGLIDRPTISQVLKWLRDTKGLHISIGVPLEPNHGWNYDITKIDGLIFHHADDGYKSYEEAALAGIEYVLDYLI